MFFVKYFEIFSHVIICNKSLLFCSLEKIFLPTLNMISLFLREKEF